MTKKNIGLMILLVFVLGYCSFDSIKNSLILSPVISTGVSTDGNYVITAHASRKTNRFSDTYVVLWDVKKRTKKILAEGINPFSAFFIPESHEFMWQDKDNIMHIQNVKGEELLSFEHLFVLSQFMSTDKKTYLSTSKRRNIYSGYGKAIKTVLNDNNGAGTEPLYLSVAGNYFLTSNYGASFRGEPVSETNITESPVIDTGLAPMNFNKVTLWDKKTLKPVAWLNGNGGKTFSLLSPDGKWAISGDENAHNYMWPTDNLGKRFQLAEPFSGIFYPSTKDTPFYTDKSQLLDPPSELDRRVLRNQTIAYAFLTSTDFIHLGHVFQEGERDRIAPLYTVGDPWIKGYVDLQEDPMPSLNYYARGLSIASSYKAHVLVTGQAYHGGINVYQYHPDKKELERIWVAEEYKYW